MKDPKTIILSCIQFVVISLIFNLLLVGCSKSEDPIYNRQLSNTATTNPSSSNPSGRIKQTVCSISGSTVVSQGNAIVSAGTSVSYTYTNSTGTAASVVWTVLSDNPSGSITINGSGATVTVTFASNFISGTIDAFGSGGGVSTCEDKLNIALTAPVTCSATIHNIWCSPASSGYNAEINVDVNVSNPFPNTASVLIQWNPNYFSGLQVAGGLYNLAANSNGLFPSQFDINAQTSSSTGFYVPIIVQYTDLVTNAVCTVNLNPLVTGGCNHAPM